MSLTTFAEQALADIHSTAAIAPSSRFLARAMVEPLASDCRRVVELGPGTGSMTRALLEKLPADARVLAFEVNPSFVEYLRREISDPRLEIVEAGAETASGELARRGWTRIDAAVSSLGLGLMSDELTEAIFSGLTPLLRPEGVLTQFQYVHRVRMEEGRPSYFNAALLLEKHFSTVGRRTILRNLPPAFVYECRA
jgi:phospholipid N-methyltransferase